MPPDTAFLAAEALRKAILARERTVAVRLIQAYGRIYTRLQGQIDALTARLDTMDDPKPWQVGKLDRLKALKIEIRDEIGRFAIIAENEIDEAARQAILAGQADAQVLAQQALPGLQAIDAQIMATWQRLNPQAVEAMLGFLSPDSPLMVAMKTQFGPALADIVGQKLLDGIALGYNPRKVASIIRRELGQGLFWALRTARTAQLNAYREATRASYLANSHIVKGWIWRSARDSRTCMSCIAKDGTVHPNSERLEDHHNGRCVAVPVTVTYRDLGYDVAEPTLVLKEATGAEWFNAQGPGVQRAMMGPQKYAAFKAGKFQFEALSKATEDPVWGTMFVETPLKDLVGE